MTPLLFAFALQASTAVPVPELQVGWTNWQSMPEITSNVLLPSGRMMAAAEPLILDAPCRMRGQSRERIDVPVRYAVRFDAERRPVRVLIEDKGCRPLETLVGGIVSDLAQRGHLQGAAAGWYASEIRFNLEP